MASQGSIERTPAYILCDFLAAFKRKTAQQPTVQELHQQLYTVNYADRLSAIKVHNLLGTILCTFASDGRFEHAQCVIECLNQSDRLSVYQLSDCGKNTLMHQAAYNGHAHVITFVLSSLESDDERLSLLLLTNTSGYTTLDCGMHDKQPEEKKRAVRSALMDPLTVDQRRALIDVSFVFQRDTSEMVINQLIDPSNALLDIEQHDEAAPVDEVVVENQAEVIETHPVQADQERRITELENLLEDKNEEIRQLLKRMRKMEKLMAGLTVGHCNLQWKVNCHLQGADCTHKSTSVQDESSSSGDSLPSSGPSSLSPQPQGAQFAYHVSLHPGNGE